MAAENWQFNKKKERVVVVVVVLVVVVCIHFWFTVFTNYAQRTDVYTSKLHVLRFPIQVQLLMCVIPSVVTGLRNFLYK